MNYSKVEGGEYRIRYGSGGDINTRRFVNTLDYSLDLIKLREVYEKVYRKWTSLLTNVGKNIAAM